MTLNGVGWDGDGYGRIGEFGSWRGYPVEIVSAWVATNDSMAGFWMGPALRDGGYRGPIVIANGGPQDKGSGDGLNGHTWASAASGSMDNTWRSQCNEVAQYTQYFPQIIFSFAHEMNGSWFGWSVHSGNVANYHRAFDRFIGIARSIIPNVKFVQVFNFNSHSDVTNEAIYHDAVDLLGIDWYDITHITNESAFQSRMWQTDWHGTDGGLSHFADWARSKGKRIYFQEWGCSDHDQYDNPWIINRMAQWFKDNSDVVYGQSYFNILDRIRIYPTTNIPNASAAYKTAFGTNWKASPVVTPLDFNALDPTCWIYAKLPADTPVWDRDVNGSVGADLLRQAKTYYAINGSEPCIDYDPNSFSVTCVVATNADPQVTISWRSDSGQPGGTTPASFWLRDQNVRIPIDTPVPTGTDGSISVYNRDQQRVTELWRARKVDNTHWECAWGGDWRAPNTLHTTGAPANQWDGRYIAYGRSDGVWVENSGVNAAGICHNGIALRPEEMLAGQVNHVIGLALPEGYGAPIQFPGTRTWSDHGGTNPNQVMEGQMLRFPASLNLANYNLTPAARTIAKAAQEYGIVIHDRSGSVQFISSTGAAYPGDPWNTISRGNWPIYEMLNGNNQGYDRFPIEKLVALPLGWKNPNAGGTAPPAVTTVTPAPVTFTATSYTIPKTTGVVYKVGGVTQTDGIYQGYGEVTVTASAASSAYQIAAGADTTWSKTFPTNSTVVTNFAPDPRALGSVYEGGSWPHTSTFSKVTGQTGYADGTTTAAQIAVSAATAQSGAVVWLNQWFRDLTGIPSGGQCGTQARASVACTINWDWVWVGADGAQLTPRTRMASASAAAGQVVTLKGVIPPKVAGAIEAVATVEYVSGAAGTFQATNSWAGNADGFFDGATPDTSQYDYSWTGTANASPSIRTTLEGTPPVVTVTPLAPTANATTKQYTIPTTLGVEYLVGGAVLPPKTYSGTGTVVVTARAITGYQLAGGATTSWTFNFGTTATVTPITPTFNKTTNRYTIPAQTGVEYLVGGQVRSAATYPGVGVVTITARATSGYVLSGTASWTDTFPPVYPSPGVWRKVGTLGGTGTSTGTPSTVDFTTLIPG